ncbi:hypothetical protein, partial [Clostridium tarantellae]|uniref:hypothetical protein n=1 Tax=Clostridium tarantellae TaxID=39493 RepID=UPI0014780AA4
SRGFKDFYDSIFQKLNKIYSLNGGSNNYKTNILKEIINKYSSKYDLEVVNSAIDTNEIEGVIIRKLNFAIVNGTPFHKVSLGSIGVETIDINLNEALDLSRVSSYENIIIEKRKKFFEELKKSHKEFEKALKIHDDWEKIYIKNLDFKKANEITEKIIKMLIPNEKSKNGQGLIYDKYLGAATAFGAKDFIPNITEKVKRYFIKGRPGTGKSTLLKKLKNAAIEKGYDVEFYHCGFDPKSIDMVISRELGFAIFDSTAPHEYFPSKSSDEVIDTYKEFVQGNIDEENKLELERLRKEYKNHIAIATTYLIEAMNLKKDVDIIYDSALNERDADIIIKANFKIN